MNPNPQIFQKKESSNQNIKAQEGRFQQFIFFRNFKTLKTMILLTVVCEILVDIFISQRRVKSKMVNISDTCFWLVILLKVLVFQHIKPNWQPMKIRILSALIMHTFLIQITLCCSFYTGIIIVSFLCTGSLQITFVNWKKNFIYGLIQLTFIYSYVIKHCPLFYDQLSFDVTQKLEQNTIYGYILVINFIITIIMALAEKHFRESYISIQTNIQSSQLFNFMLENCQTPIIISDLSKQAKILYSNKEFKTILEFVNHKQPADKNIKIKFLDLMDASSKISIQRIIDQSKFSNKSEFSFRINFKRQENNKEENSKEKDIAFIEQDSFKQFFVQSTTIIWKKKLSILYVLNDITSTQKEKNISQHFYDQLDSATSLILKDFSTEFKSLDKKNLQKVINQQPFNILPHTIRNVNLMKNTIRNASEMSNFLNKQPFEKTMEVFYFKAAMIQKLEISSDFAKQKNVKILLRFEDDIPEMVSGDRKTFSQLFVNLITKTLSVLSNTKLQIYVRLRGIINQYKDFTVQIIFTYYLSKKKDQHPYKILDNSIKKPGSTIFLSIFTPLDVLQGNQTTNDSIFSIGMNLIEPLVTLLKGSIKQREKPDRVDIFLNIPFLGSKQSCDKQFMNPILLTNHRKTLSTNRYFWGTNEMGHMNSQSTIKKSSFKIKHDQDMKIESQSEKDQAEIKNTDQNTSKPPKNPSMFQKIEKGIFDEIALQVIKNLNNQKKKMHRKVKSQPMAKDLVNKL